MVCELGCQEPDSCFCDATRGHYSIKYVKILHRDTNTNTVYQNDYHHDGLLINTDRAIQFPENDNVAAICVRGG